MSLYGKRGKINHKDHKKGEVHTNPYTHFLRYRHRKQRNSMNTETNTNQERINTDISASNPCKQTRFASELETVAKNGVAYLFAYTAITVTLTKEIA